MSVINTIGRRKTAVARVYLRKTEENEVGEIIVNDRKVEEYFPTPILQYKIFQPFELTGTTGQFIAKANIKGGGFNGQAEALRLSIARALVEYNEEFRPILKKNGLLRRDPRMVERKKPGRPKARKRFQFSKR